MSETQNTTPETANDEFTAEISDEDLEAVSGGETVV